MHKATLMMLLAVMSSSAVAEWVPVVGNETVGATAYADPATIRKTGNKVKMWDLLDYKTAQGDAGMQYMSMKAQTEYDCKEEQSRPLYLSFHSENMGKGKVVDTYNNPSSLSDFPD